jgi:hypothetical protein
MRTCLAVAAAMLPVCAAVARAQEGDTLLSRRGLPPDVAREAASLFNTTKGLRVVGPLEIEAGREVVGDVAVLNGPLTISGHVTGRVLAINSDVILRPSSRIDGDLLVVGGEVAGRDAALIGGEIRIYRDALRYHQEGDEIVAERDSLGIEGEPWWRRWEHRRSERSWSKLQIASAGAYNRVEGLPINLGPQINRRTSWGNTRLDAYAILRTGSSFSGSDGDIGHNVRAELQLGRFEGIALGGRLFNIVDAVEPWQLSDLEVGLASFLVHRDYRDYFQRHGASASASVFAWRDVRLTGSFSDERWLSRAENNPFTLFRSDADWRPNPMVDEGRMHVANATFSVDTRNDEENPWSGWYITADWERGAGMLRPVALIPIPAGGTTVESGAPGPVIYSRGFLDLRRYNRVSPDAQLNLRMLLGGWLGGDPLPIERRLSVDGPGVMPGYGFRGPHVGADLGTCNVGQVYPGQPALCDRIVLVQAEYRGDLHFDINPDWESHDDVVHRAKDASLRARAHHFHRDGTWVVFADAGRGWLVGTGTDTLTYAKDRLPPFSTFRTDLGAGVDFGGVGFYLAKAMTANEPVRLFVRLRHRF